MNVERRSEHDWLRRLVGRWAFTGECETGQEGEKGTFEGQEEVRALGEVWIVCDGQGQGPDGQPIRTVLTLGYDPLKPAFVGTFIGSMMTFLWVYEGHLDEATGTLTMNVEGPDFSTPGKMVRYRDVMMVKNDDERELTSHAQQPDGSWQKFMTQRYRRLA